MVKCVSKVSKAGGRGFWLDFGHGLHVQSEHRKMGRGSDGAPRRSTSPETCQPQNWSWPHLPSAQRRTWTPWPHLWHLSLPSRGNLFLSCRPKTRQHSEALNPKAESCPRPLILRPQAIVPHPPPFNAFPLFVTPLQPQHPVSA